MISIQNQRIYTDLNKKYWRTGANGTRAIAVSYIKLYEDELV